MGICPLGRLFCFVFNNQHQRCLGSEGLGLGGGKRMLETSTLKFTP